MTQNPIRYTRASIVDSNDQIKNRHITDFQGNSQPEKEACPMVHERDLRISAHLRVVQQGCQSIER